MSQAYSSMVTVYLGEDGDEKCGKNTVKIPVGWEIFNQE